MTRERQLSNWKMIGNDKLHDSFSSIPGDVILIDRLLAPLIVHYLDSETAIFPWCIVFARIAASPFPDYPTRRKNNNSCKSKNSKTILNSYFFQIKLFTYSIIPLNHSWKIISVKILIFKYISSTCQTTIEKFQRRKRNHPSRFPSIEINTQVPFLERREEKFRNVAFHARDSAPLFPPDETISLPGW